MRFPCHGRELGWSDPCGLLATSLWPKVGSLQPSPVFCPRPKSTVASHATSMPQRGVQSGLLSISHRIDLVPPWKAQAALAGGVCSGVAWLSTLLLGSPVLSARAGLSTQSDPGTFHLLNLATTVEALVS